LKRDSVGGKRREKGYITDMPQYLNVVPSTTR